MSLRNLLNSLKTFLGGTSFKRQETHLAAQHDPEAEPVEECLDDELDVFQRLETELEEGEFACTICVLEYEGLIHEVDIDFQEVIEAFSFTEVIEILSARFDPDYSWSVQARDWTGAKHSHKYEQSAEALEAQHLAHEAQQMQRSGCQDVEWAAF
ncbi:hypothetical protein [Pseudovibrio sp. Tun.PSC04-5.I4]|uniref:hypothetical protein n=1 Tax=Pseudovibrio sp. Tun.PSC04-5.I4 TaxID=1798213 RepID=UPI00087E629B|nr:hypothetical protein [Pseudovibrio sp. Tun.PSC04-5.I4]SDQ36305.1 hypothetical protein SAMN04515695_0973 [Pseudovibrio sp. Tun.PSC04-5.I4]